MVLILLIHTHLDLLLKKIDNKYSTNTIKGIVSVLKQALRLAITLEFVDKEYCSNLKMPSSEEKEISVFTKKEQQVIESFCLNHKIHNHCFVDAELGQIVT